MCGSEGMIADQINDASERRRSGDGPSCHSPSRCYRVPEAVEMLRSMSREDERRSRQVQIIEMLWLASGFEEVLPADGGVRLPSVYRVHEQNVLSIEANAC